MLAILCDDYKKVLSFPSREEEKTVVACPVQISTFLVHSESSDNMRNYITGGEGSTENRLNFEHYQCLLTYIKR